MCHLPVYVVVARSHMLILEYFPGKIDNTLSAVVIRIRKS